MITADIVVVGAGPAGVAAAITAARAGRHVVMVDKARFPRDKFCGDGLTAGALRLLDRLGLDPATVPSWRRVEQAVIRSPSGRVVELPLPPDGTFAAVATRSELDAALVELARANGVDVHEGHSVTAATLLADRIVLQAGDLGELHARYAIAADGMWSPLRKLLGVAEPGYLGDFHAFRQYFRGVDPAHSRTLHVWFEPEILPGYVWSFPLAGHRANVGFGIHRDSSIPTRKMKSLWPELLDRPYVREALGPHAEPEGPHRAWPIPAQIGKVPLTAPRTLFVGDAAAATDPMTGEGIGQALWTGMAAADAISAAGPAGTERACELYERSVSKELARDHAMAAAMGQMLETEQGARAAVKGSGLSPWVSRNFARWLFEDYPRAAVLTPARWHRGMFTGPGAFRELGRR